MVPHPPQFWASLDVFAQAPLHGLNDGTAQLGVHVPLEHCSVGLQTWPHPPQLLLSVEVFVHRLGAHRAVPLGQVVVQEPLTQAWSSGQALRHAPQFWGSEARFARYDPQFAYEPPRLATRESMLVH